MPPACTCGPGYAGDGMTCQPVDPCATDNGGCAAACVNDGGTASCYTPQTCADVAAKITLANDTDVTLYAGGDPAKPWTAFCHDSTEYLTVTGANFGQYTAGGKSPGTDVRTTYARLRLVPATLRVDVCDVTFAATTGMLDHDPNNVPNIHVTAMPLGVAMDCKGDDSHDGAAAIDLAGTPFVVTSSWTKGGNNPGGTATPNARAVTVSGGGTCGWNAPSGSPGNPFNTFANSKIVGVAYQP